MCTPVVASVPAAFPKTISPEGVHRYLLKTHRLGNRINYRFIQGLHVTHVGDLWKELGAKNMLEYADEHFGMERSALTPPVLP